MIFWLIIAAVAGFLCGFLGKYFKTKSINKEVEQVEQEHLNRINELSIEKQHCEEHIQSLRDNLKELGDWRSTEEQKFQQAVKGYEEQINSLQDTAKKSADEYFQKEHELAQVRVDNDKQQLEEYYKNLIEQYQKEYLTTLEECVEHYTITIGDYSAELEDKTEQLIDIRSKLDALVEADKRKMMEETQKDFFRLFISSEDLSEINKLREVSQYLKNTEPLNKVIWKVYYEKPYTALVGRVIGQKTKTGIYKITNINNNMCYVGQAVDIADRWRQHIKRGLGAETPTRNKLYPAMLAEGVENFSFEVIEECAPTDLNTKEKYWIEFYHGQDYGYNIKAGG